MTILFGLTSFLAAVLLFSVEPMIGKMVLPAFGGTPAVWLTCLVFYQAVLLCGYLAALALLRAAPAGRPRKSAVALIALVVLLTIAYMRQPIAIDSSIDRQITSDRNPSLVLLSVLLGTATLPLILVATTTPLIQGWFARTGHPRAGDPYFLYAASNAGSLLALLAYPFLIEPNLGLFAQSQTWRTSFLVLAMFVPACGLLALGRGRKAPASDRKMAEPETAPPGVGRLAPAPARPIFWLALVFIPSTWLMGVTAYLTTDLASIPLMWIIPLALYLLSFILAFSRWQRALTRLARAALPSLIVPLALVLSAGFVHLWWLPLHLVTFFVAALACHGALAEARPAASDLSIYYVWIALGGLCGGVWTALVAPLIFDRVIEYPLAMVLVCMAALAPEMSKGARSWKARLADLSFAAAVLACAAAVATNQAGLADSMLGVWVLSSQRA